MTWNIWLSRKTRLEIVKYLELIPLLSKCCVDLSKDDCPLWFVAKDGKFCEVILKQVQP